MKADAGAVDSFPPNSITLITLGGREIGVIRWREKYYAVLNLCPHAQAPVCKGRLSPRMFSRKAGTMSIATERGTLVCPWHRYEFDLETGRGAHRPQYKLKMYPVWPTAGRVEIDLPDRDKRC